MSYPPIAKRESKSIHTIIISNYIIKMFAVFIAHSSGNATRRVTILRRLRTRSKETIKGKNKQTPTRGG